MYKLLLLTPDASDYVTDGSNLTFEEACERSAEMGSRWFFYPLHFIIVDKGPGYSDEQRIIDAGDELSWAIGKKVKTVFEVIKETPYIIE
jgi:hypothetical protein